MESGAEREEAGGEAAEIAGLGRLRAGGGAPGGREGGAAASRDPPAPPAGPVPGPVPGTPPAARPGPRRAVRERLASSPHVEGSVTFCFPR